MNKSNAAILCENLVLRIFLFPLNSFLFAAYINIPNNPRTINKIKIPIIAIILFNIPIDVVNGK